MSTPNFDCLLERSDVEVNMSTLIALGGGLSASVYANDEHVVKLQKNTFQTELAAHNYADTLYAEQEMTTDYMSPENVAQAHFVVSRAIEGVHRLLLVQPRIKGVLLADAIDESGAPDSILAYLSNGIKMYSRTKKIPDLACVERRFNPLHDPNTQVKTDDGMMVPVLVDTTYGRTQRLPILGKVIHGGIAWGVRHSLKSLE